MLDNESKAFALGVCVALVFAVCMWLIYNDKELKLRARAVEREQALKTQLTVCKADSEEVIKNLGQKLLRQKAAQRGPSDLPAGFEWTPNGLLLTVPRPDMAPASAHAPMPATKPRPCIRELTAARVQRDTSLRDAMVAQGRIVSADGPEASAAEFRRWLDSTKAFEDADDAVKRLQAMMAAGTATCTE